MICSSDSDRPLSDIMRDFKKYTSREILKTIQESTESRKKLLLEHFSRAAMHLKRNQHYKVWLNGYHAEELYSNRFIFQKVEYLHNNPVKENIVEFAEDYTYSSGPAYAGKPGLIDVIRIPQQLRTMK